jgi:hypothetical protein
MSTYALVEIYTFIAPGRSSAYRLNNFSRLKVTGLHTKWGETLQVKFFTAIGTSLTENIVTLSSFAVNLFISAVS